MGAGKLSGPLHEKSSRANPGSRLGPRHHNLTISKQTLNKHERINRYILKTYILYIFICNCDVVAEFWIGAGKLAGPLHEKSSRANPGSRLGPRDIISLSLNKLYTNTNKSTDTY